MTQLPNGEQYILREKFLNRDRILQITSLVLVLLLTVLIVWQRGNIAEFSMGLAKYWGLKYLAIFLMSMLASASIVIPVPGLAFTSLIGAISTNPWDPLWVGVVSGLGATIGECTDYLVGYGGRIAIHDTPNYKRVVGWMSKWGSLSIFLLALIPNPLFDLVGISAAIMKYPMWKFILVGAAGRLPKHILFSYLGYWGIHLMPN